MPRGTCNAIKGSKTGKKGWTKNDSCRLDLGGGGCYQSRKQRNDVYLGQVLMLRLTDTVAMGDGETKIRTILVVHLAGREREKRSHDALYTSFGSGRQLRIYPYKGKLRLTLRRADMLYKSAWYCAYREMTDAVWFSKAAPQRRSTKCRSPDTHMYTFSR